MRTFFVTAFGLLFALGLFSQPHNYQRVKISIADYTDIQKIAEAGVSTENLQHKPGNFIIGEFSEDELKQIKLLGYSFTVLIENITQHYKNRNIGKSIKAQNQQIKAAKRSIKGYTTPTNFKLGSMGGYHTYQELLDELDEMKQLYPNLISEITPIDETLTIEGREVYWVRISNNPNVDQDKPQVLYTALTHAREPVSMQQMLYQMWYILENYESDTEIAYLVNNLEMYFIPCVNPDGYIYNETTDPNGGGMWRKNRRNNGDGTYGVDINRNFGYMWGHDDSGSSPNGWSETFRGTSGFSEPETQLVKQFCEEKNILLALNNHTYSDILIYPWGYANATTPDSELFEAYAQLLTEENGYEYGTCYQTLQYVANGGSDDWFYGEQDTKNKIIAFTPEAGSPSDGFWPAIDRIEEICAGHTSMNLNLARLALPFAKATDLSYRFYNGSEVEIPIKVQSLGVVSPADYTMSIEPLSANIQDVSIDANLANMETLDERTVTANITFAPTIANGEEVKFVILLNNGLYSFTDTITKLYGNAEIIVDENGDNLNNWTSTTWGITNEDDYSAPTSISDSPQENYSDNANTFIEYNEEIDLTNAIVAYAEFRAKWDIETGWDYAQFLVSTDGGTTWIPQSGMFTAIGSSTQDYEQPLYHGNQAQWVKEEIDLTPYTGETIKVRFRLVSDVSVNKDGFYFDDFRVEQMTYTTLNLPNELTFIQHETLTFDLRSYISNFSDDLTVTWQGNENIAITNNDWTISISSSGWLGTETVTFTISGDFGEVSKQVAISCVSPNATPVITGQQTVTTNINQPITLTLNMLQVDDTDNNFPEDFTLTVYEGNNYSFNNHTVTPTNNFTGFLAIPLSINDGANESEIYSFSLEVVNPSSIENTTNTVAIFYSPNSNLLTVNVNNSDIFNQLQIIDMQGKRVLNKNMQMQNGQSQISISKIPPGLYIVRLVGKQKVHVCKMVF